MLEFEQALPDGAGAVKISVTAGAFVQIILKWRANSATDYRVRMERHYTVFYYSRGLIKRRLEFRPDRINLVVLGGVAQMGE